MGPKPYSKYEGPYITWEFLQFGSLIKLQVLLSGLRLFRVTDDGFRDSVLGLFTADGHNPHLTLDFCICLGVRVWVGVHRTWVNGTCIRAAFGLAIRTHADLVLMGSPDC